MQDPDVAGGALAPALERIWLVGCGAMGSALAERWIAAGLAAARLTVIDPDPRGEVPAGAARVATAADAAARAAAPTAVVLAVKPQQLREAADDLHRWLVHPPLLVSMLAGVRLATLAQLFPGARLARIMPNTPARLGRAITVAHAPSLEEADRAAVAWLCAAAGAVRWLDEESRLDAVTAISGSGPAYLFRFIEALAGAGEAAGLDPDTATALARETVVGAAALAGASDSPVATLRQQVTSPGGTTEAGLDVLDGDGALSALLRATVRAAAERSRALAAQAEVLAQHPEPPLREAHGG